jgi:hypothetical protein
MALDVIVCGQRIDISPCDCFATGRLALARDPKAQFLAVSQPARPIMRNPLIGWRPETRSGTGGCAMRVWMTSWRNSSAEMPVVPHAEHIESRPVSGLRYPLEDAGIAQLAEQLFCKQQVTGSIPVAGSNLAGDDSGGSRWKLRKGRR